MTLDLGTALAGQTFQIRFRIGTDGGTGAYGWDIDDVSVAGVVGTPFSSEVADDGNCSPVGPVDDPIISGGGGCCDSGRSSGGNTVFALLVLGLVLRRRGRDA